jgi:endonuclease/exonuclease/phosphatase (EEP) superfamily protein YafD
MVKWLRQTRPDIVALQELPDTPTWIAALASLKQDYPYIVGLIPHSGRLGLSDLRILSRHPARLDEVRKLGDRWSLVTEVDLPHGPVEVVTGHPNTPRAAAGWMSRNAFLALLPATIAAHAQPSRIYLGDMNLTSWSPAFATFIAAARLKNADRSFLPAASRIVAHAGPLAFGSPIDHILATGDWKTGGCHTGPELGSDHVPVICDLER